MKISKRVRRGYALALACLLTLPCLSMMRTQAVAAIEVDRICSLTVSAADSGYAGDFDEMTIPVSLYRVAGVDTAGRYTPEAPFSKMDFTDIGSSTTADDWQKLAGQAEECLKEQKEDVPVEVKTVEVKKSEGEASATGTFSNLKTGMYLVVPKETENAKKTVRYSFTPYLTALPASEYAAAGTGSDEWDYNPTIGLKAEGEELTGSLVIRKTLENYNASLGAMTCVFQVEGHDENGVLAYSNVVGLTLTGAGDANAQTAKLTGIPAGLTVTVTEVYAGGSYEVKGDAVQKTVILSDGLVGDGESASVSFTNSYDGGNRGGYGVTNHFESDGKNGWTWENPTPPVVEENE
ncbi:MAG: hypothetical protein K2O98_10640 [Lachnospiraceae bacterium]|nr:hypothetical protein [Lachnospiraceae bacterium]